MVRFFCFEPYCSKLYYTICSLKWWGMRFQIAMMKPEVTATAQQY